MDGIGKHEDRFFAYSTFFGMAANGTLPHVSWVQPNDTWTDHPCNDVAKGERMLKDIYEALRAGPGWNKTLFAVVYDDAGGMYDHVVPPYAPPDDAPCNVGNRPGSGPPPADAFARPLRSGRKTGLGYETNARLLTAAERETAMSGRAPRMSDSSPVGLMNERMWHAPLLEPPSLDNTTWELLNTFAGDGRKTPENTFVSFTRSNAAPPGMPGGKKWLHSDYKSAAQAMPVEFHEVPSRRTSAGRVYKLLVKFINSGSQDAPPPPPPLGWITFTDALADRSSQWFRADGNESEAALVQVQTGTGQANGSLVLLNLGKDSSPPSFKASYISFSGGWVRCHSYNLAHAMSVKLLKPGTPAPAPAPTPPPAPSPCAKKFDFRRVGLRVAGMLMSPYIPSGTVFQEPAGPYNDSQFDLSSLCATIKHLFGLPGFLTQRDAWAGSFHELLTLQEPRTDTPLHFPDGPPIHKSDRPQGHHGHVGRRLEQDDVRPEPRHCSPAHTARQRGLEECAADGDSVTLKQRNKIIQLSAVTGVAPPTEQELAAMTKSSAGAWIGARVAESIAHGERWRKTLKSDDYAQWDRVRI